MNIPLKGSLSRVSTAVAAGWNVEHRPDGRHAFPWTPIPYAASSYGAASGMTWTVAAEDQLVALSSRRGESLRVQLEVQTSSVGGAVSVYLTYRIPGGFSAVRRQGGPCAIGDNGTGVCGWWVVAPGFREIRFYRDTQAATTFTASANNTAVVADMEFEVQ